MSEISACVSLPYCTEMTDNNSELHNSEKPIEISMSSLTSQKNFIHMD